MQKIHIYVYLVYLYLVKSSTSAYWSLSSSDFPFIEEMAFVAFSNSLDSCESSCFRFFKAGVSRFLYTGGSSELLEHGLFEVCATEDDGLFLLCSPSLDSGGENGFEISSIVPSKIISVSISDA